MSALKMIAKELAAAHGDMSELLDDLDIRDLMRIEEANQLARYAARYPVGTEIFHNMRRNEPLIVAGLPKNSPNYIVRKPNGAFRLMFASDVCAILRLPNKPHLEIKGD